MKLTIYLGTSEFALLAALLFMSVESFGRTTFQSTPRALIKRSVKYAGDLQPDDGFVKITTDDEEKPSLLQLNGGDSERPGFLVGDMQLEELENDVSTITTLRLLANGCVELMATHGPSPLESMGEWSSDGSNFWLLLSRSFELENLDVTYDVSRLYRGSIETHPEYTTIGGQVMFVGSAEDDPPIGYFNSISFPDGDETPDSTLDIQKLAVS